MRRFVLTIALFAGVATLRGFDITPQFIETPLEGSLACKEVRFLDGDRAVLYQYPAGWKPVGGGNALKFTAPDASQADLTIEAEPHPRTLNDDELRRCRDIVTASLPKAATGAAIDAEARDVVSINNFSSLQITVSYTLANQSFRKSVFFLFADSAVVRFSTVGPAASFDRAQETVRRSLYSWRWETARAAGVAPATKAD